MGAWSAQPFGNDTAADFAWELDDASDWSTVEAAIREALEDEAYLDGDAASIAIACAEVVAHGLGRPTQSDTYTESVEAFVERVGRPEESLVDLALQGLSAATSDEGELAELWDEAGSEPWRDANELLRQALALD